MSHDVLDHLLRLDVTSPAKPATVHRVCLPCAMVTPIKLVRAVCGEHPGNRPVYVSSIKPTCTVCATQPCPRCQRLPPELHR